ncbi:hypothetical protein [uncultured Sulfitobacter sp.]|uniref:hypothetical protein n=1 Tax=uncultured Sulfitobacter sp. TaxID=191468 RepID=UPI002616F03F|nr:hypothetical protein [uncultured Sulfitobacter sp.]
MTLFGNNDGQTLGMIGLHPVPIDRAEDFDMTMSIFHTRFLIALSGFVLLNSCSAFG